MEPTAYANIITQQQFEDYSAAWQLLINSNSSSTITQVFQPTGMNLLATATFTMPQVMALLSSVGMRYIFARFLYRKGQAPAGQADFTLALCAADHDGQEISAWYAATTTLVPQDHLMGAEMPAELAQAWQANWTAAPPLTRAMFLTKGEVLEGYTFPVSDFLDPLIAAQPFAGSTLNVNFGMHNGFAPTEGDAQVLPMQTFGLLLQITNSQGKVAQTPSFDLANPVPPKYPY